MKHRAFVSQSLSVALILLTLTSAALTQVESVLYSFTALSDGGLPVAALTPDGKGNFYSTVQIGGSDGGGGVFELSPGSNGTWSEKVIYNFTGGNGDAFQPLGNVIFDSQGNLYGTTVGGGASYSGTVFELTPGSNGTWTEKILYSFTGGSDGGHPFSGVTFDKSGNLYGTTENGGTYEFGTVFELVQDSNGTWTEKVLHSFSGGNDGSNPYGSTLVLDGAGNVYGVTAQGGPHDYGVVFKLTAGPKGNWTEKVIYAFIGVASGSAPSGGVVLDSSGNVYGVSSYSVFELSPGSNGVYTKRSLHNFAGGSDGAYPYAQLIFDKGGNLYGTTANGGLHRGTVFELSPGSNGIWTEKILHSFSPTGDGLYPDFASLVLDAAGKLYGTTPNGGASNYGVVFEVTP